MNYLEDEIDRLAEFLLSTYPGKTGAGDYEHGESAIDIAIRLLSVQPCGHPNACIVQGEQVGPGEFVHYCGWCASLDATRWQTEQAILGSLRVLAKGELDRIEQHGGTMAFARRVLALAEEGLA